MKIIVLSYILLLLDIVLISVNIISIYKYSTTNLSFYLFFIIIIVAAAIYFLLILNLFLYVDCENYLSVVRGAEISSEEATKKTNEDKILKKFGTY